LIKYFEALAVSSLLHPTTMRNTFEEPSLKGYLLTEQPTATWIASGSELLFGEEEGQNGIFFRM